MQPHVVLVRDPVTGNTLAVGRFTVKGDLLTMTDPEGVPLRCDGKPIERRLRIGDSKWDVAHFLAWKSYRDQKKTTNATRN